MNESLSCWSAIELYEEYIKAVHSPLKAERILNELRSAALRFWVEELGFTRSTSGRKMTLAEIESAKQLLQKLGVSVLLTARQTLQQAFESQNATVATRNTYGNRFNQFLSWCEQQEWWPDQDSWKARVKQQCCPVRKNSYGLISNAPLTQRRGQYLKYGLTQKDTPVPLQKELDDFYRYLTEPEWPLRVVKSIEESSALEYIKDIRLILGWCCHHRTPAIVVSQLRLSHLIPVATQFDLEHLTPSQQAKVWKQHKQSLETLLCNYFRFLREVIHSTSPRTKRNKLEALSALAKYMYMSEVEENNDYALLPVFKVLNNHLETARKDISEWVKNRQSVSDFEKKWPDTEEGETALGVVRAKIVEPLRQECRPRNSVGRFRRGSIIATSYQHY